MERRQLFDEFAGVSTQRLLDMIEQTERAINSSSFKQIKEQKRNLILAKHKMARAELKHRTTTVCKSSSVNDEVPRPGTSASALDLADENLEQTTDQLKTISLNSIVGENKTDDVSGSQLDNDSEEMVLHAPVNTQIFVRSFTGRTMCLHVNYQDTINTVKERLQQQKRIAKDQVRMVYGGKELDDDLTLADYKIKKDSTIMISLRLRGGNQLGLKGVITKAAIVSGTKRIGLKHCGQNRNIIGMMNMSTRNGPRLPTGLIPAHSCSTYSTKTSNDTPTTKNYKNGDFGKYQLVSTGIVSERNPVPEYIKKPEYYISGQPHLQSGSNIDILTDMEVARLREACKLARLVLNSVIDKAREGVTTDDLDKHAHEMIVKNGAYPSPLNYHGYPKSICTSANNVACHGIPDDRKLVKGDLLNIDVTVYMNGFHGDCSETVLIGQVDQMGRRLVEVAKECLLRGISVCGPGKTFREIGKSIQQLAFGRGFTVVPAFTGHGIGKYFHMLPDIYHFDFEYNGTMEAGMAFTIEPVIGQGSEFIEILEDEWTAVSCDGSRSAQFEHTILVTNGGVEILTL